MCLQGRNGKGTGVRDTKRAAQLHLPPSTLISETAGAQRARSPAHRYRSRPRLARRGAQALRNYNTITIVTTVPRATAAIPPSALQTRAGCWGKGNAGRTAALRVSGRALPGCRAPRPGAIRRSGDGSVDVGQGVCGDVKKMGGREDVGMRRSRDGSADGEQGRCRDASTDVGQHDAGLAARMQGRADAGIQSGEPRERLRPAHDSSGTGLGWARG